MTICRMEGRGFFIYNADGCDNVSDNLQILLTNFENSIVDGDVVDISYDLVADIDDRADAFDVVEPILRLIERHPDTDFGMPGPLVHFVESFHNKGYDEKLVESIQRKPTKHTLWMLNRVINGSDGEMRNRFIKTLDCAVSNSGSNDVVVLAAHFKSQHC